MTGRMRTWEVTIHAHVLNEPHHQTRTVRATSSAQAMCIAQAIAGVAVEDVLDARLVGEE